MKIIIPCILFRTYQKVVTSSIKLFLFFSAMLILLIILPHGVTHAAEQKFLQIPALEDNNKHWALSVQTLLLLTSITFLPAVLLMMSGFTRIIIVLGILRNALGIPSAPPNQILLGLSLCLTFFVMSPVLDRVYYDAYLPFSKDQISIEMAVQKAAQPIHKFMLTQTRETDLSFYAHLSKKTEISIPEQVPMRILIPAFVTSELKTAFQIGFTLFIPFLIIDLVIASILMALGMMMLPPTTVSLPFKLMLFVMVDGWQLLLGSLTQSFFS